MVSVLIADDSDLFRQRLTHLITEIDQVQVVKEARDGFEVLDAVQQDQPDIIILDFYIPGANGTALLEAILLETSHPDLIICTAFPHPLVRQVCLDLGAKSFLDKSVGVQQVVEAVAACIQQRDPVPHL
jgi:DNA-binding NarL/FixJ family response regulator